MRKKLMAGPYLLWMLVFTIVPLLFVFYYGFTSSDGTFTFSNITAIFEKIHIQALGLSLLLAVITTAVCLLFAYPLALILSKSAAKNRSFVIFIFILPMWINFLLRIIAIRMLLSDNGILNYILSALNLPELSTSSRSSPSRNASILPPLSCATGRHSGGNITHHQLCPAPSPITTLTAV